jgi:DNA-binding LacI/PurR family transcriptional regulator
MTKEDPEKNRVGLREIAALAKVSLSTVSRVLNGNSRVDPAIRKIVLDAAAKLNFDLSKRNNSKALAFLLSNRQRLHVFHSRVLSGAEAHCAAHGWDMVFLSFNYSANATWEELHLPKLLQSREMIGGLMLAGTNSTNLLELLDHKAIPYVALGSNIVGEPGDLKHDLVFSDDAQGGFDMTRYLISLGHRDIWFVGNIRLPWFARLFAGYRRAMEAASLAVRHTGIDSEEDDEAGYLGTKYLLSRGEPVTAIFAGNDLTAHGVYRGLRDSGLKIPEDISVVGCGDTVGMWLYPGLSTVRAFPEQLGKQMVELILNRIANPGLEPQRLTLPTELIKRDSCRQIFTSRDTPADTVLQGIETP